MARYRTIVHTTAGTFESGDNDFFEGEPTEFLKTTSKALSAADGAHLYMEMPGGRVIGFNTRQVVAVSVEPVREAKEGGAL